MPLTSTLKNICSSLYTGGGLSPSIRGRDRYVRASSPEQNEYFLGPNPQINTNVRSFERGFPIQYLHPFAVEVQPSRRAYLRCFKLHLHQLKVPATPNKRLKDLPLPINISSMRSISTDRGIQHASATNTRLPV